MNYFDCYFPLNMGQSWSWWYGTYASSAYHH